MKNFILNGSGMGCKGREEIRRISLGKFISKHEVSIISQSIWNIVSKWWLMLACFALLCCLYYYYEMWEMMRRKMKCGVLGWEGTHKEMWNVFVKCQEIYLKHEKLIEKNFSFFLSENFIYFHELAVWFLRCELGLPCRYHLGACRAVKWV